MAANDSHSDDEEESQASELKRRVREIMYDEYEDEIQYLNPGVRLKDLNLSASYELRQFEGAFEKAIQDMDEPPEWEDDEQRRRWKANVAMSIIRDELEEAFGINTGSLSLNMGIERRNNDYIITAMY